MKARVPELLLYALAILLSLGALWMSVSTPSFSMDNKAVYQGF